MKRPEPMEWPNGGESTAGLPHGTPLLVKGELWAAWRDASFWPCPDVRKPKVAHVAVVNRLPQTSGGAMIDDCGAACDPRRIILSAYERAHTVPAGVRCTRPACAALFAKADEAQRKKQEKPGER